MVPLLHLLGQPELQILADVVEVGDGLPGVVLVSESRPVAQEMRFVVDDCSVDDFLQLVAPEMSAVHEMIA